MTIEFDYLGHSLNKYFWLYAHTEINDMHNLELKNRNDFVNEYLSSHFMIATIEKISPFQAYQLTQ